MLLLLAALLPVSGLAAPLTAKERAGKRIYVDGESSTGAGISAVVGGDAVLPASAVPCAGCHGGDGLGRPEGGADPGVILWSHLLKRYGHAHANGRRHPAFDAKSLARSIEQGVDPAGNALEPAMPRYSMSTEDMESLIGYMRRLEHDTDPGVSAKAVRIGTILPARGRLAPVGAVIRGIIEGAFAELNATGGIHGRRLELAVASYDPRRETGEAALARLLARGDVFALASSFAPAAEEGVAALAERENVPLVGPLTAFTREAPNASVFYVDAGIREQSRVLARWAGGGGVAFGRAAILHASDAPLAEAARAAADELAARGRAPAEVLAHERGRLDPAVARRLRDAGVDAVFFLGADADLAALAREAAAAGWAPAVLLSGTLSARAAVALPRALDGRVYLAYGALPGDETPAGTARLAAARARGRVGDEHHGVQASAYAAVAVTAEGLKRTGRHLTREGFVRSLEALYRFESGLAPPVTYGPARRVGALGSYVVAVDLAGESFKPVTGWISLE